MKIAYVIPNYPAVSHTFILREVLALRARGVDVQTFSLRRAGNDDILGPDAEAEARGTRWLLPPDVPAYLAAAVWAIFTRPLLFVRTFATAVGQPNLPLRKRPRWIIYFCESVLLSRWLARGNFEHVHSHFGHSSASVGMLAARLAKLTFSVTCHGSDLIDWDQTNLPYKVSQAKFVACVSEFGRDHLQSICTRDDWEKLKIVRCGPGEVHAADRSGDELSNVILCVARLLEVKGHEVLIDALGLMRDAGAEFRCVLVGDGPLRGRIEARAKALGLTDRISLTGSLPPAEVAKRYSESSVVVLSSHSEGVPVVLMEAMAHSKPVVATRVGGVAELVDDGHTGLLVPPGDSRALADALLQVLSTAELAVRLGAAGCRVVKARFDADLSAGKLEQFFAAALKSDDKLAD